MELQKQVILMIGLPGSNKSETAARAVRGSGGIVIGAGTTRATTWATLLSQYDTVVLDFPNLTVESRAPFLARARELGIGVSVRGIYLKTTIQDCQVRLLQRARGADTGGGGATALFMARKRLQEPTMAEGFASLEVVHVPIPEFPSEQYPNKAVFFDIDGTLRDTDHLPFKYPTSPEEVRVFPGMAEKVEAFRRAGYMIFGVSNQSGVAAGRVSAEAVEACMEETRRQLGIPFPISYCPHKAAPIVCFCRKPQVGQAMAFIERHRINPRASIMVGDQKSDQTMAERLGMQFIHATKLAQTGTALPGAAS